MTLEADVEDIAESERKSATMPGVSELRSICNGLIDEHFPEYRHTALELELFKHGHLVIWGVANRPQYNPIELQWAYSKRHVHTLVYALTCSNVEVKDRYDFTVTRSIRTLIEQIKVGWNGGTWVDADIEHCEHKPGDATMCKKFIRHSISELESWIKRQPAGSDYNPTDFSTLKCKRFYNNKFYLN